MADVKHFIDTMSKYHFIVANIQENNTVFSRVERLSQCNNNFLPQVLYIGNASQIATLNVEVKNGLFLLVNDVQNTLQNTFLRSNTILLSEITSDAELLYAHTVEWLIKYTTFLENINRLMQIFCSCYDTMPPNIFIEKVATIIKNPIIVLDANFKILFSSSIYEVEDLLWQENIVRRYCTYEQIIEMQNILGSAKKQNTSVIFSTSPLSTSRLCFITLHHNRTNLGVLIIFEVNTSFSKMDNRLLGTISNLISLLIYSYYGKNKMLNEYAEDNIFIECLSGELKTYTAFRERIRGTIFSQHSSYSVIVVDVEHFENFDPRKEVLRSFFAQLFKRSWTLWYNGNVIVIVDLHFVSGVQQTLSKATNFFKDKRLRLGISDTFDDIYYTERYYHQGVRALELSRNDIEPPIFAYYNDYKFNDLILTALSEKINLMNFIDDIFFEILRYDKKNGSDYLKTTLCYFNTGKNLGETSDILHVHKNTVLYRINKVKEIFALDLHESSTMFRLLYSSYIYQCIAQNDQERH